MQSLVLLKAQIQSCNDVKIEDIDIFNNSYNYDDKLKNFNIKVYSPYEMYYTSVFNSGILTPDEAYELYGYLFNNQQVKEYKINEEELINKFKGEDIKKLFIDNYTYI